jgi:hypothetical protein
VAQAPKFPVHPAARFRVSLEVLAEIVTRLVQRTLVLEDGVNVVNYVATISASYTSGQPTVVMPNGDTAGPFPCLDTYTPHANDVVLMVPNGQSYVIAGTFA